MGSSLFFSLILQETREIPTSHGVVYTDWSGGFFFLFFLMGLVGWLVLPCQIPTSSNLTTLDNTNW